MPDKVFLDTNILIYVFSEDERIKQSKAVDIIEGLSGFCIISTQVINEFSNILLKKFKLTPGSVENAVLEIDNALPIVNFNFTTQIKALRLKERYKFQFYDALIVATALENGCNLLFSEDMQHNQVVEDVLRITDPFK